MNTQTIHQNTASGLALIGERKTMTSIELRDLINAARKVFGEPTVENSHFVKRIEDELEGELGRSKTFRASRTGTPMKGYDLTFEQCLLVGMRESKAVRRSVLMELKRRQSASQQKAEFAIPETLPEALRLAADLAEKNEALTHERDEAVRTKALIGSRREATAMATASAAKREAERLKNELGKGVRQATIMAVERAIGEKLGRRAFVPLRRWCKENGVEAALVPDDRYGEVRAWPAEAWVHCYDIDLGELFGEEL